MRHGDIDPKRTNPVEVLGTITDWDRPAEILTDFLDTLQDGVIVVGADLRIKFFNKSYMRLFEVTADDVAVGDHLRDVLRTIAARGMLGDRGEMSLDAFVEQRMARWATEADRVERRVMHNGRVLDIFRAQTNRNETVAIHVDVTESVQNAAEVERQQTYMQSVLAHTSDGITLLDASGNFVMFNERFLELYDIDPKTVYWGIPYDKLAEKFGDLNGLVPKARDREIARRRAFAFDPSITSVRRPLKNGRTLHINKAVLPDGGCVMTYRDITEDLANERELIRARRIAEESSRLKSDFVARMSHEMRTPLNGILGVAALLERTDLDEKQTALVDVIVSSGTVLLRLIDDILDLSRIEAESFVVLDEELELDEVVRECLGLVEPGAAEAGLEIRYRPPDIRIPPLRGDAVRVKQILLNLLTNAVKFTERGHVELGIDAERGAEGITVTFSITDTGVGIPADEMDQIFQRFYQIDSPVTRQRGGMGLGLSITQKLVDAMGGAIQVRSNPGAGTTFTVRLTFMPGTCADAGDGVTITDG